MTKAYTQVTESPAGGFDALFAVRLESIVVFDPSDGSHSDFSFSILNRQIDLINSLAQPEDGRVANLRYICRPDPEYYRRGSVEIAFVGRVRGESRDEAASRAGIFFRDFWTVLNSMSDHYDFSPVTEESEFLSIVKPFEIRSIVEIARREDLIEATTARRIRGFGDADTRHALSKSAIYYIYPYIWGISSMESTLKALLRAAHPSMISVLLKPVRYTGQLHRLFDEQIERIEAGLREARVKHRLEEIQRNFKVQLLRIEDSPFQVKSYIVSEGPIDRALVDSFGVDVTEHSGSPDILQQVRDDYKFSGGYSWHAYEESDRKQKALEELERIDCIHPSSDLAPHGFGEIRHLFDSVQAQCVFRLPVPQKTELSGIPARYYKGNDPPNAVGEGDITIGMTRRDGQNRRVGFVDKDRLMHSYIVGQTGTGKSTLLLNMIVQDIRRGAGLCVLDPHGELIDEILPRIPESRRDDIIYVNLEDTERPIGLNMLEASGPLDKDRVVQLLFEIFDKTYDLKATGGPIFEMYMKLALYTVMADPDEPSTILDVQKVFIDREYRESLLEKINDPYIRKSWQQVVEHAGGDVGLRNVVPYITSKVSMFVYNTTIRNIVSQKKSSIDFRQVIEGGKVLLVDLSKGRIGSIYSNFLGMVFVNKVLLAALGRGTGGDLASLRPFYLYVDEFQNLATDSFTTLLSEARKYRLGAVLANQYLAQIPEPVRNSIFGNVGSLIAFRVGVNDAQIIEREFMPAFTKRDLMNIPNWKVLVKMLWKGDKMAPFELDTLPPIDQRNDSIVPGIIRNSRERYGKPPDPPAPSEEAVDASEPTEPEEEILFRITAEAGGLYEAEALLGQIQVNAKTVKSLQRRIRRSVKEHFDDQSRPKRILLRFEREESIPLAEEKASAEESVEMPPAPEKHGVPA